MGLDMFLSGRTSRHIRSPKPEQHIDGMPIEEIRVKLGYWRKDWTLHNAFCALLSDECNDEVSLSAQDLRTLLGQIQAQEIKTEEGDTYTGENCAEYGTANTLDVLAKAIEWIERAPDGEWRDAVYRGSW